MNPGIKRSIIICAFSVFVFSTNLFGKAPIKYGKPKIEDLQMTVYEPDSSAEAVILCNYGYFNASSFNFTQTVRIKILKKSGTHWANREFSSMGTQTKVRGKTFNLVDGEIVEDKLKNESIFRERVIDDYYKIKVAMPNVKVGSVIDIEIFSSGIPQVWRFQDLIPVRWSELQLEESQYVDFRKNTFGYIPFDKSTPTHWITSNVPAFKKEPYMDSYKNYISKMEFDIQRISFPGFYKEFASTWESVGKILMDDEEFGGIIKSSGGYLKDIQEEIESSCSTDEEKIRAAFEKIKVVKWNNRKNNTASTNILGSVFKDKIGNSADINLMLIKLLSRMDIKAYPVILSTRDNGILSPVFPSMNKLNYTICCAEINGEKILLDPTDEKIPFGLLPERVLNNNGRLIYSTEKTEQVPLSTKKKNLEKVFYQLQLNPDNSISGKRSISYSEYGAYKKRKKIDRFNSDDDYLASYENKFSGLTITDYEIKNEDNISEDLIETWTIELKKHVEVIDDLLMINLHLFDQIKQNQFKLDERVYPVNYPYCSCKSNTVNLIIPEGYEVSELPPPARLVLPEKGGSFILSYAKVGKSVSMSCRIIIDKKVFLPTEYPYLKEFFTQIVKKQAEPIILKKI